MGNLRRTHGTLRRAGVTLTELLVVLSIIVVLVGLTFTLFTVAHQFTDKLEGQVASANPKAGKKRPPHTTHGKPTIVPNEYLVTFKNSVTDPLAEANRLAHAVPATLISVYATSIKACAVRVQPGEAGALKAHPTVAAVEPNRYRYPCQSVFPTGVSRIQYIHAPRTPPYQLFFPGTATPGTTSSGGGPRNLGPGFKNPGSGTPLKAVAVIDSGIDSKHPDLNVVFSQGFGGQPDGEDGLGHGTHVSGIVGAKGVGVTGVFPGVPLWALKVFDASGNGATDAVVISALDVVAANADKIMVCNMSLGGQGVSQALNNAVTNCVNLGVVMCVAAGNDSNDAVDYSPASSVGAICVSAHCDTDGLAGGMGAAGSAGDPDDTFASFSNWGAVVALHAPGEDIYSTLPLAQGGYGFKSGTSMACPTVAGLCALVITTYGGAPGTLANGTAPRNLGGNAGGVPLVISNPAQVLGFLQAESVESIPGLAANKDTRKNYPLITGRP